MTKKHKEYYIIVIKVKRISFNFRVKKTNFNKVQTYRIGIKNYRKNKQKKIIRQNNSLKKQKLVRIN